LKERAGKKGRREGAVVTRHYHHHAALSDTPTTEYKYGEFVEITGKVEKSFRGMFSMGCGETGRGQG
jgi:hypothetical protein